MKGAMNQPGWFQRALGAFGVRLIQVWLRFFGRFLRKDEVPWLAGPVGPSERIGEGLPHVIARQEALEIDPPGREAGLMPDFGVLAGPAFNPSEVHPDVRRFYEHTTDYDFDVWNHAPVTSRIFLWILVKTVSRRMDQLNFPVTGLEMSLGMSSDVIRLRRSGGGEVVYTCWLRRFIESGRVLYAGFYTTVRPPGHPSRCVKVVFPLPKGNATVLLRPEVGPEASLRLISRGTRFGGPGFYRSLEVGPGRWRVLYLRSLHEVFDVYVDPRGVLRCDHRVHFLGLLVLKLHYKMTRKAH